MLHRESGFFVGFLIHVICKCLSNSTGVLLVCGMKVIALSILQGLVVFVFFPADPLCREVEQVADNGGAFARDGSWTYCQ